MAAVVNKPFTFAAVSERSFPFFLLAIVAVVLLGSTLDLMEVDAAQYAGMSRDMVQQGNVLKLYYRGQDYLDKPPLLFWLSALSFKLFGVHDASYRLPSIFFAFLGMYATYRFALLYHGPAIARTAALMFGCSAAFFLMTNDVRCDTILTGSVITAIWMGCSWLEHGRWWWLAGSALATAAGMLAKGPIGAVAPIVAVGAQLVMGRKWSRAMDPIVMLYPVLIGLSLLPMCVGLYEQHGVHGLRFYFWEQSFGRITGENRWKDDSTVLFFTHELLWQMLPWTLLVLSGLWNGLRSIFRRMPMPEYASTIGSVLVFMALSLSQFKLPHYLFVIVPLFAVQGASVAHSSIPRALARANGSLLFVLWTLAMYLTWVSFPEGRVPYLLLLCGTGLFAAYRLRRDGWHEGFIPAAFWLMIAIGVMMNGHFYRHLLTFQANALAGQWAAMNHQEPGTFYGMQVSGTAMDFYAGYPVPWVSDVNEARSVIAPGVVIYTDVDHREHLLADGLEPRQEIVLLNYPAQRLAIPFLFPEQRHNMLEARYLMVY